MATSPTYNLAAIYTTAWNQAAQAQTASESAAGAADSALGGIGSFTFTPPTITPVITDLAGSAVGALTGADGVSTTFNEAASKVKSELVSLFSSFIGGYFPDSSIAGLGNWLSTQLTVGGSGINPAVEAAVWAREQDRLTYATQQAIDALMYSYSGRRFSLPPGAAAHEIAMMQREQLRESAKSSRDQAVEAYKAELEVIKLAVQGAIAYRGAAMSAAGEYIRSIATGYGAGTDLARSVVTARGQAASAATDYYRAQVGLTEVDSRTKTSFAQMQLDASKTLFSGDISVASKRADVAIEAARMTGTLAAAALNGVGVRFGYNESNDVTSTTL